MKKDSSEKRIITQQATPEQIKEVVQGFQQYNYGNADGGLVNMSPSRREFAAFLPDESENSQSHYIDMGMYFDGNPNVGIKRVDLWYAEGEKTLRFLDGIVQVEEVVGHPAPRTRTRTKVSKSADNMVVTEKTVTIKERKEVAIDTLSFNEAECLLRFLRPMHRLDQGEESVGVEFAGQKGQPTLKRRILSAIRKSKATN